METDAQQPVLTRLSDVLGQERALETLLTAASAGRVHHAWIFTGPAGVGKMTAAVAFAALILDPTTAPDLSGALAPEEGSPTQRMVSAGAHPDLHIITKELARYSDDKQIRDRKLMSIPKDVIDAHLLGPVALAPTITVSGMASKVFIVDEAELLDRSLTNAPVQNAILKTLEEPPAGSVIILVTSAEDALLPTIRSRCQRVAFGALDERAMLAWLKRSGLDVAEDERDWVLRFAAGSPGRALLAVKTGLYQWAQRLDPMLDQTERGVFHGDLGPTMAALVSEWAEAQVKASPNASKEAANLAAARHMLTMIVERYRAMLRASDVSRSERALRAIDRVYDAERHLQAHVSTGHALENLAAQLAHC